MPVNTWPGVHGDQMSNPDAYSVHERWARFRFTVVGQLLTSPPAKGELYEAFETVAAKSWVNPINGEPVKYEAPTIERWYYEAKGAGVDVLKRLRRKVRSNAGQHPALPERQRAALQAQHAEHGNWSYQLHYDNLVALIKQDATLGAVGGSASRQISLFPTARIKTGNRNRSGARWKAG
jgi:hypothetical protein